MFHHFRSQVEQMLEDGYSVQPITEEDRERKRQMQEITQALQTKALYEQYDLNYEQRQVIDQANISDGNT